MAATAEKTAPDIADIIARHVLRQVLLIDELLRSSPAMRKVLLAECSPESLIYAVSLSPWLVDRIRANCPELVSRVRLTMPRGNIGSTFVRDGADESQAPAPSDQPEAKHTLTLGGVALSAEEIRALRRFIVLMVADARQKGFL